MTLSQLETNLAGLLPTYPQREIYVQGAGQDPNWNAG